MKMFGNTPDDLFDAPMREFPWPAKALYWVCLVVVSAFTKLYWHWTCDGSLPYAKPGEQTGKVIIANHASMFDPVVLIMISAFRGRRLRPLYKSEFESSSFVNWFFSRVGAIPLKRGSADTKAIRRAVKSLQRGEDVCVFPEGTRIRDPHARAGSARRARASRIPHACASATVRRSRWMTWRVRAAASAATSWSASRWRASTRCALSCAASRSMRPTRTARATRWRARRRGLSDRGLVAARDRSGDGKVW